MWFYQASLSILFYLRSDAGEILLNRNPGQLEHRAEPKGANTRENSPFLGSELFWMFLNQLIPLPCFIAEWLFVNPSHMSKAARYRRRKQGFLIVL